MTTDEKTVLELIIGCVLFGIAGALIILFFPDRIYNEIGFIWGVVVSIAMTLHMYRSLKISLELGEQGALKNIRLTYAKRVTGVLIAFAVLAYTGIGNVITGVIGLFALKVAAYIQPITHKILERKFTRKGR